MKKIISVIFVICACKPINAQTVPPIHIYSSSQSLLKVENDLNYDAGIEFKSNLANFKIGAGIGIGSNSFVIYDLNASKGRFSINSVGNIGFGTTSPKSLLTLGDATSTISSTKGLTLGTDQNSLEFLHSESASGYGSKIYGNIDGSGITSMRFAVRGNTSAWTDAIYIRAATSGTGRVGIGTTNPDSDALLTVKGSIHSTEIKVLANAGVPDYVFEEDYELLSLAETKKYIRKHKHLPEIPSGKEIEANGIVLGDMNMRLLKKIEELTLYQIELLERLEKLETENVRIDKLEKQIQQLKNK